MHVDPGQADIEQVSLAHGPKIVERRRGRTTSLEPSVKPPCRAGQSARTGADEPREPAHRRRRAVRRCRRRSRLATGAVGALRADSTREADDRGQDTLDCSTLPLHLNLSLVEE